MTLAARTDAEQMASGRRSVSLRRAILPIALTIGGIGTALLVQAVFNPFTQNIPLCPLYHLTGLYCPGCGATRAVHALLDGDLLLALRNNLFVIAALPVVGVGMITWTIQRVRGRPFTALPPRWAVFALAIVVGIYAVLRNIPVFWFLAPTSLIGA